MKHVCKHSPKHVSAIVAYLRALGAEVGRMTRSRCLHLPFVYAGRTFVLPIRHTDAAANAMRNARILVRRMLREAGILVPQRAGAVA